MSGTRRTPLARRPAVQITPRAVVLFVAMGKLRCTCLPPPRPPTRSPCAGCARWYDLHAELHVELHCKPWEWPCVARQSPKRAGSTAWNETIAGTMAQLDEAVRRRAVLDPVAAKSGRAGEPPSLEEGDPNAEPVASDTER
jgi:hypothetical protein